MKYISIHNGHDSSVTAFDGAEIVMHFELERYYNKKHFCGSSFNNEIAESVDIVLNRLGWNIEDIQTIVMGGLYPWSGGDWSKSEFKDIVTGMQYKRSLSQPYSMWSSIWRGRKRTFVAVTHHVNHMAYSYYTSPFNQSALLAIDGRGDFATNTAYGLGEKNKLTYFGNTNWDNKDDIAYNNIGITYSCLGRLFPFLGFDPLGAAGKAMGLSSYGKPVDHWRKNVRDVLFPNDISGYDDELGVWATTKATIETLKSTMSMTMTFDDPRSKSAQDLMATIQDEVELYMVETVKKLGTIYEQDKMCLSGGCALNCQANTRIIQEKAIEKLYIPPACSDSGLSIGAGLYYWHNILGNDFQGRKNHTPYLGDSLLGQNESHSKSLNAVELTEDELIEKTTEKLMAGKIIAWAQGRSEIGPRSLGNRSIFCLPSPAKMKDVINEKVKHREFWRPFAPICTLESVH